MELLLLNSPENPPSHHGALTSTQWSSVLA
jgi:hypothetical protein